MWRRWCRCNIWACWQTAGWCLCTLRGVSNWIFLHCVSAVDTFVPNLASSYDGNALMMKFCMLGQTRTSLHCLQPAAATSAVWHSFCTWKLSLKLSLVVSPVPVHVALLGQILQFLLLLTMLCPHSVLLLCRGVDNDVFAPQPISPTAATSAVQCYTQYAQMADAWWLPTTGNTAMTTITGVTSFSDCVAECDKVAMCQYLTYDYDTDTCYVRTAQTNGIAG